MTSINQIKGQLHQGCSKILNVLTFSCSESEPLEKITKITHRTIDIIQTAASTSSKAFTMLSGRLKESAEIFESIHIFERYKELFFPDPNGKNFFRANTRLKIVDRVSLTIHSTLKTTGFLMTVGLLSLGRMATVSIGHLTVFKFVTEAFILGSSFFGSLDSANKLPTCKKQGKEAAAKIQKWQNRDAFLAKVAVGDKEEIAALKEKYEIKSSKLQQEALADPILQAKQKAYQSRLEDIKKNNFTNLKNALATNDTEFKLKKWEAVKINHHITYTKSWLNIAKNIAKIAVVTLALVLIGLNLWTAPYLLTLLGVGIISDGLGYSKILYDHYVKPVPVPERAASAA